MYCLGIMGPVISHYKRLIILSVVQISGEHCIIFFFLATMFLEIWKRRQSVISWEWDLRDFEDFQHTRPEFEAKVKTTRFDTLLKDQILIGRSLEIKLAIRDRP